MAEKILIEVDMGLRAVEKFDVSIYRDGKIIQSFQDKSYHDLIGLVSEFREGYKAEPEVYCLGEDCMGRAYRWKVDV
jgi:hypothetical protein